MAQIVLVKVLKVVMGVILVDMMVVMVVMVVTLVVVEGLQMAMVVFPASMEDEEGTMVLTQMGGMVIMV